MPKETYKPKVISLFSGAGGMDLGFVRAGADIIWANDFFQEAVSTYNNNISPVAVFGDITKIASDEIPDNPDIVIGGFPCQGFSISNTNRSMEDKRNFLYRELLRVIKDKRPKYFVAENVKGLLSMEGGKVIEMIIRDFEDIGYKVDYRLLNAANYGVPQMRQRVIIIGNNIGEDNPYPVRTHYFDTEEPGLQKCATVKDVIGELADIPLSETVTLPDGRILTDHIAYTNVHDTFIGRKYEVDQHALCDYLRKFKAAAGLSNKKIAEALGIRQTKVDHWFRKDNNSGSIPDKDDYLALKKLLNLDDEYDERLTEYEQKNIQFEQSLRITNWDRPSDTITATSPEIHVNRRRRLSVRECARLQTFPDDFTFCGTLEKKYRQVGNAVPVMLAEVVAKGIVKKIKD